VWVGRLGFGPAPTARALRLPLEKLVISKPNDQSIDLVDRTK